jgi:hypothetical protein
MAVCETELPIVVERNPLVGNDLPKTDRSSAGCSLSEEFGGILLEGDQSRFGCQPFHDMARCGEFWMANSVFSMT